MPSLASLFEQMHMPADPFMRAEGYALWIIWQGDLNPVVPQTMQDYGGLKVVSGSGQSLWFFFSTDAFLASARLVAWAKFNTLPVTLAVMPATLHAGANRSFYLDVAETYKMEEASIPQGFEVWVHADEADAVLSIPGLTLGEHPMDAVLSTSWVPLHADTRLPYQSSLGWYTILRPLGNQSDRQFIAGWRAFFEEVESILKRNKFRYTLHENFLLLPLDSLREYKSWVRELLHLLTRLKRDEQHAYWPCAIAIVDKGGMSFNSDLPRKVNLDWTQMAADYPHMSFRNALLLGKGYTSHTVRFAAGSGPDDWCNVSLAEEEDGAPSTLPLLVPGNLILGDWPPCFYCGQRSHPTNACPSRHMPRGSQDVWRKIAVMDFTAMKEAVSTINAAVEARGADAVADLIQEKSDSGTLVRALFDIASFCQVREISTVWRTRGKQPPRRDDLVPEDVNPIWELAADFAGTDKTVLENALQPLLMRYPRDYRIRCLLGFAYLERDELDKAATAWKEAESMSPVGFIQAWHMALQGRLAEYRGNNALALSFYSLAEASCKEWLEPAYRKLVCQVKTGFAEQALGALFTLLQQDPNYFNRALLDPEMERGQLQILKGLTAAWNMVDNRMKDERTSLERFKAELVNWFLPDHPFATSAARRIKRLQAMGKFNTYVPCQAAIQGRQALERDMQQVVLRESREFRNLFRSYLEKLAKVRDEAAWFPYRRFMVEFNKNYNQCAVALNWAMRNNLTVAEAFKRAQTIAIAEKERLQKLEKRLSFLRLIRDATLFLLVMLRSFFWIEVIGLILVLVILPLALFYGQKTAASWGLSLAGQQWQVQKAATFIISFLALGFAMLRTVLRFEKIRDKVLEKARAEERAKAANRAAARKKR